MFKSIYPLSFLALFVCQNLKAEVLVQGEFLGKARVETGVKNHYRHSLDCYTSGKGSKFNKGPEHLVQLSGLKTQVNSGSLTWATYISSPFTRMARSLHLNSQVTENLEETRVLLQLTESRGVANEQFDSGKCWHDDGQMVVKDAEVSGTVKIQYKVPDNVWALSVGRTSAVGVFGIGNFVDISTALNSGYDAGLYDGVILWVKPGQILEQEIKIPESVPGRLDLGSLEIVFRPVGKPMGFAEFVVFKDQLKTGYYSEIKGADVAVEFLTATLSVLRLGDGIQGIVKGIPILDLKRMSDELFEIANDVIPVSFAKGNQKFKADGMLIKSAAAMAAYQLAKALMQDLSSYCKEVEITLPFTGEKQKVIGLRAASFWLGRSMNMVKSYSYDPLESFMSELQSLQKAGKTPADIVNDRMLAKKLQDSYLLLTRAGAFDQSPFNIAYVDLNRMSLVFKDLGAIGNSQESILAQLKEGSHLEGEFIKSYVRTVLSFKKNRIEAVDLSGVFANIQDLRKRQKNVETALKTSIRLLGMDTSDDQNQIWNQVFSLLNRQINIFSEPVNVPYFDRLREEFKKTQVGNLEESVQGWLGTEKGS
jgi:hypothetical protein